MDLVVDASVTACWFMPDEAHPRAEAAFELVQDGEIVVPRLWWFEMRNLLLVNERRGRLKPQDSSRIMGALSELPVAFDDRPDEKKLIDLARRRALSVYDAAYLELAMRRRLSLATLDGRLTEAARSEGAKLV